MIEEITISQAFTYEDPPDGGHLNIVDPYDGCTLGCPYCFQRDDLSWSRPIKVKMNISTRGRYGLRALIELSTLSRDGPVTLRDLSEKQNMSINYLEQIFYKLKKAGIVQSIRGAKGGYTLASGEDKITVSQIINALDGPISISNCDDPDLREKSCTGPSNCVTRVLWKGLEDRIEKMLSNITLKDLRTEKLNSKSSRSCKK